MVTSTRLKISHKWSSGSRRKCVLKNITSYCGWYNQGSLRHKIMPVWYAMTYESIHHSRYLTVAIKIIDIKEIKEKYVIKNLHREARIMSSLSHPCIASLFQTMQMDNIYYLVTELVSGGDLCSFIIGQRYGKLEERPAKVYARQFVSALAHMHSFGIIHRDLKMENVILNSTQTQIKIVDFGLSNVWSNTNPLRTHCGSPEYAAPELFIAGREYGPEVDLWSLGIIFYGMVVGQLPFVGGRKNQLSSQERRKRLVAQINKGLGATQRQAIAPLSPEFRTMLNKLLAADPAKRISTREILVHPWINDKGRKIIRKHPLKDVDNAIQTKITQQLGKLFEMDEDSINTQIYKNPFGRLGGMYNILKYKHITEQFNVEHISPSAPRNKLEASPVRTLTKPDSPSLAKSQHTLYNQCIVLLNKVSKQHVQTRAKSANQAILLSKNYSKLSRPQMDHVEGSLPKQNYSKTNSSIINRKIQENTTPTQASIKKSISSKVQIIGNKQSPALNTKRPNTAGIMRNSSKPTKRECVSAATTKTHKTEREFLRQQICLNQAGMGDGSYPKKGTSNDALRKQRSKDPLANEPIARSIAGYLVKNVPNYMFHVIQYAFRTNQYVTLNFLLANAKIMINTALIS